MFLVDSARLLVGARYRGELEERVARLGDEVAAGRGRLVLVLEDAELLIHGDAGTVPGGGIAFARLLRAGGWILPLTTEQLATLGQVVPGWETLVQRVEVPEWHEDTCEKVLAVQLPALMKHHGLRFDLEAPRLALRLARRYLQGQPSPA